MGFESRGKMNQPFRYWINTDEKTLDARIGFMQHHLRINRHLARSIVVKEPRVIMFGIGPMYVSGQTF